MHTGNQLLDSQKGHTDMHLHEGKIWLFESGLATTLLISICCIGQNLSSVDD